MKKIQNNLALILAISTLSYVSCKKDFLDQKPTSTLNELNYFKNVAELENGLVACYGAMKYDFDDACWQLGDVGSDDADCGSTHSDQPQLYDISYSQQNNDNGWVQGWWMDVYMIIARCNEVIDRSSGTQGDASEIEKIVDQAKFLRAVMFYYLVTAYGDVPLVNKFLSPDKLNLRRAPADSVWKQIESDLKDATNLPTKNEWNNPVNQSGRITSGAAWSMLGKAYLTQQKYELANSAFDKVVQSGQYSLVPDFGKIFRHDGENCEESIFEIQCKSIPGQNLGTLASIFRLPRDPNEGWGFDCPTQDLLNEFEAGDPRIIYTFMFPGDVFPGYLGITPYIVRDSLSPTGYNSRKAWIPHAERDSLYFTDWDLNYRYMRYAEVLLLYAESLNEANKPADALNYLNMVRTRARNTRTTDPQRISCAYPLTYDGELLPDVTTTDQSALRQAIWHEQRVEMALEGHRRQTLLRTNRFIERMAKAKDYEKVTVQPYQLLLPIPASEIELSNHVLTQNPGY
jgi:starch-binding outer membrane protein, SusD/RagB family